MSVQVSWDDDTKRIMGYMLDNNWTWDEFFAAKKQANAMMDTVPHKLGVIVDATHSAIFPSDMLTNARNALRTKHPNVVIVVIVANKPFLNTMLTTLKAVTLFASRLQLAHSLDEARALIQQRLREYDSASVSEH